MNESMTTRRNREDMWRKKCISIDHELIIDVHGEEVNALTLVFDVNKVLSASWWFFATNPVCVIMKGRDASSYKEGIAVPFFEPDFADYSRLVQKLKTYMTFS